MNPNEDIISKSKNIDENGVERIWIKDGFGKSVNIKFENLPIAIEREFEVILPPEQPKYQLNTSHTSFTDRAKEFAQGAAHNIGGVLDSVNKNVSYIPPMLAAKAATSVGNVIDSTFPEAGQNLKDFGQSAQNVSNQFYNSNLADQYANSDLLKTDNNPDQTSEVMKAGGEMLGEGIKWATGAKALDNFNKAVNGVQIVTKTGTTVAVPWINKLNSFLASQGESVGKTASQFAAGGMGAEIGKQLQGRDERKPAENNWEELKNVTVDTTVDMAGFLFGGLSLDATSRPLIKATKEAGKTLMNYVDYLKNPTKENWSKVKEEFPELVKKPIQTTFNKVYEKLVNTTENKIDEEALSVMEKSGIKPSSLSIYEDNDRVFQIANILPSKLYRTYVNNLEKDVLKSIETDLDMQLGIIDPMTWKAEESMVREASKKLDTVIEKPNLQTIYRDTIDEIENQLTSIANLPRTPLTLTGEELNSNYSFSPIKTARDAANNEINRVKENFTKVKNNHYEISKTMLSSDDYVNLDKVHKAASELFVKYDIPGTKKTSMGNVRNVAEDVKKGTAIHKNLPDMISDEFNEEFQVLLGQNNVHPEYLLDMARGLNQQISEGYIKGDDKVALTKLTKAIEDTFIEATEKGTIKDKRFLRYKKLADEFFKDTYSPFVALDATKAISSGKTPHYIWEQMGTIDGRHKVKEILSKFPQGKDLFAVLQRTKAQEFIIGHISDGTDINPKKLINLFENITYTNELVDLIGEENYGFMKKTSEILAKNISDAQQLSKNPIIADNSVNNIIKLLNTREGIEIIKEQVMKLPEKEATKVMNSINRVAAKFNIENEISSKGRLNNDKLMSMLTDLKEEDYLVGILGKKELEKFKKDILPLSKKIVRIHNKDVDAGGYIASRDRQGISSIARRAINESTMAITGYGAGGVKGAIAAVLGKNWIAYSFAKAATDPKLVNRLIELGRKGNEKQLDGFLTRIGREAAKNTLLQLNKPAFKLYNIKETIEKGKETIYDK